MVQHALLAAMGEKYEIDDDALLSGLPRWNDHTPIRQAEEKPPVGASSLRSNSRPPPAVTTVTAEDDMRMALRMAALRTLKRRPMASTFSTSVPLSTMAPSEQQHAEVPGSADGRGADAQMTPRLEVTPGDTSNKRSADVVTTHDPLAAHADEPLSNEAAVSENKTETSPRPRSFQKRPAWKSAPSKRIEYKDVDAPSTNTGDDLFYGAGGSQTALADARQLRPRVSYADEFSSRPRTPAGDVSVQSWVDRVVGKNRPYSPPVRAMAPAPSAASMGTASGQDGKNKFVIEPSWETMIIEMSDDDDSDEVPSQSRARLSVPSWSKETVGQHPVASRSQVSEVAAKDILAQKEMEIRTMQARIHELERRKMAMAKTELEVRIGGSSHQEEKPSLKRVYEDVVDGDTHEQKHGDDKVCRYVLIRSASAKRQVRAWLNYGQD